MVGRRLVDSLYSAMPLPGFGPLSKVFWIFSAQSKHLGQRSKMAHVVVHVKSSDKVLSSASITRGDRRQARATNKPLACNNSTCDRFSSLPFGFRRTRHKSDPPATWTCPSSVTRTATLARGLAVTTTCATAPPPCSPRWRSPPAGSPPPASLITGHQEFLRFLRQVARAYPTPSCTGDGQLRRAQRVEILDWLAAHPRVHTHFTPTSAVWLNLGPRCGLASSNPGHPLRHLPLVRTSATVAVRGSPSGRCQAVTVAGSGRRC